MLAPSKEVMSDEETISVEAEASQDVAESTETENAQPEAVETQAERKKRNDVEYNWAEARRKMETLDKQNKEMAEQLKRLQPKEPEPEVDELDKLGDDDIVTKSQVKKLAAKMAREIANEAIRSHSASTVDDRLQAKFPDFADVVTKDAIEELKQIEPELAYSLANNPDPYAQGVAAYKLLKRMGKVDMAESQDKKKAAINSQKPVSINAAAKSSAIGNVHLFENGLTPELKKTLWKEMEEARKRM